MDELLNYIDELINERINFQIIMDTFIKVMATLLVAAVVYMLFKLIIKRLFSINFKTKYDDKRNRKETLERIALSLWKYFMYFVTALIILSYFGIKIETIIAGAGVLGVVVAFGTQDLLKDVVGGFFNVFEDNISVGDYIGLDNVEGTITDIGLRSIKIKGFTGEVHVVPNSQLQHIINYSLDNGMALINVLVDYENELDHVLYSIRMTMDRLMQENDDILSKPDVMGVNKLDKIGYEIRIMMDTKPLTHWGVQRFVRGELIKTFIDDGIKIGMNQIMIKSNDQLLDSHTDSDT